MFDRLRVRAVSRLLAALVAFGLTGGLPYVEARPIEAPHSCHCHHGPGEVCICAQCHRRTAAPDPAAEAAELEKLPPCHRAAAKAARAREDQARAAQAREAQRPGTDQPMFTGCCNSPVQVPATLATPEPFLLYPAVEVDEPGRPERPLASLNAALDHRGEIPTPPPRAATPLAA